MKIEINDMQKSTLFLKSKCHTINIVKYELYIFLISSALVYNIVKNINIICSLLILKIRASIKLFKTQHEIRLSILTILISSSNQDIKPKVHSVQLKTPTYYINMEFSIKHIILVFLTILLRCGAIPTDREKHMDGILFPDQIANGPIKRLTEYTSQLANNTGSSAENDPVVVSNRNSNSSLIPLDFLARLDYFSVNDLLLNYVEGYEDDESVPGVVNRFGETDERDSAIMAKKADCIPEQKTVQIIESSDPSILFLPSCTRIGRCGGCCSHKLYSCQPTETETVAMKVLKTQYIGGSKLTFIGREIVVVEKHLKCKCGCKKQPSDCAKYQQFDGQSCRCKCPNIGEEQKCNRNTKLKLWDPKSCTCQCRDIRECTTGFYFNTNECKCMYAENDEFLKHWFEDE